MELDRSPLQKPDEPRARWLTSSYLEATINNTTFEIADEGERTRYDPILPREVKETYILLGNVNAITDIFNSYLIF